MDLKRFFRKQKAWSGDKPTVHDMRWLLSEHPNTTLLAVSRTGAAVLNDLVLQTLHPRKAPLVTLRGDVESKPDNYNREGQLKPHGQLIPSKLKIYVGQQLYMTKNVRKDTDYVNGMKCLVESWDERTRAVVVKTATGRRVAVTPRSDEDLGGLVYYPLRLGYASTIMKFQSAELEHVTLYLDRAHVPAAAYTAMSRVRYGSHCLFGGWLTQHHFTPARL